MDSVVLCSPLDAGLLTVPKLASVLLLFMQRTEWQSLRCGLHGLRIPLSCVAPKQVAFADKCLLNKIDLVSTEEKRDVIDRIKVGRAPQRTAQGVPSCQS
mgnify:CR=1 FL=1